jgi:hypothetical protein
MDATPAGSAHADAGWLRSGRGARGPRVVATLALGEGASEAERPYVAISRAGVIETVVPAPVTRDGPLVAAMIPVARDAPADPAALSLHLVTGEPAAPRLRPLAWSAEPPKRKPRPRAAHPGTRAPAL